MNEDFELRKIQLTEEEREIDRSIRPKDFSDFNGQDKLVQNLKVFVQAARLKKRIPGSCDSVRSSGIGKNYPGPYYLQ